MRLPRYASAEYFDSLIPDYVSPEKEVLEIELTSFRRCRLFGEARLLGLLAAARSDDLSIYTRIGAPLPTYESGNGNRYWKIFTE
jgi:hypothetical protein